MSDADRIPTDADETTPTPGIDPTTGGDRPSPQEADELSRAEEVEIQREIALGLERFEGGIEG